MSPSPSRVRRLCEEAASVCGVTPEAIMSPLRQKGVVKARCAVMRELRACGFSLTSIGRAMGRDHTTVLHAIRKGGA